MSNIPIKIISCSFLVHTLAPCTKLIELSRDQSGTLVSGPQDITAEIFRKPKTLDFQWKIVTPYFVRYRYVVALYPDSYQLFNVAHEKVMEPGKPYHTSSDITGGTNLT